MESFIHPTLGILENVLSIQPINQDEYFLFKNGKKFYFGYLKKELDREYSNVQILTKIKRQRRLNYIEYFQKLINEVILNKIVFTEPTIY